MRSLFIIVIFVFLVPQREKQISNPQVSVITINGPISPTTASYISRSIKIATAGHSECLLIELDTPGGLLESTKDIVQSFLSSPVPIVVYVYPQGASAGSAGVFITLAAHIAAMAPATNIGAAHPVQIGSGGKQEMDDVMKEKLTNYAESYIESIARHRKRNVNWAKSAVRESASIPETEALEKNVIDLIAPSRSDLLNQINMSVINGDTLHTANAQIVTIPMSPGEKLFQFLFRPEIMIILMLIAIYGIIGEISSPGAIIPGVAGIIALILLLYTMAAMPVNIAGFALIGLAIVLFILEAFTPTFGILTTGGAIAFILGLLMLFDEMPPFYRLSWSFLIPVTILTVLFFIFIAGAGIKSQFMPIKTGSETMIGKTAEVIQTVNDRDGRILVEGEFWNAVSNEIIETDSRCKIVSVQGLTVFVEPINHQEDDHE